MKLVNLTPHSIELLEKGANQFEKKILISIPPSGVVARVVYNKENKAKLEVKNNGNSVNIPVVDPFPVEIRNLPDPQPGTAYIVSKAVAEAAWELELTRRDLFVLYDIIRDRKGIVIGGRALSQLL